MKLRDQDPKRRRRSSKGNAIMMLVCVYIIYLGISVLRNYAAGQSSETAGWVQILFGVLFIAAGAGFLFRYFQQYRKAKEEETQQELEQNQEEEDEQDIENP